MRLSTIAFTSLRRRKSRAAFLIAGLLIGVGTVVALLSLTASLGGQTKISLKSYGANIVVTPRGALGYINLKMIWTIIPSNAKKNIPMDKTDISSSGIYEKEKIPFEAQFRFFHRLFVVVPNILSGLR